jgi:flagellar basal-body rod modification protein FlgD
LFKPSLVEGKGMVTSPNFSRTPSGTQSKTNANFDLKPMDFINMMVTQLQQQDPTKPADNSQLLAQMSQIGQLQASNTLTDSLKSMVLQNQIGSAGNMIGKSVQGLDDQNNNVGGVVNSVKVEGSDVFLELDNGNRLALARVTAIAGMKAPGQTAGITPASTMAQ